MRSNPRIRKAALIAGLALAMGLPAIGTDAAGPGGPSKAPAVIRVTVLYDNYSAVPGLKTDGGFSCLVEGPARTILFDAGANGEILLENASLLNAPIFKADAVVVSHLHGDHVDGLQPYLAKKKGLPVYLPADETPGFDSYVRGMVERAEFDPIIVDGPRELARGIRLTGPLPGLAGPGSDEQSLVIEIEGGALVITGCAHPGVVKIVRKAAELVPGKPLTLIGGFHLLRLKDEEVLKIIGDLKAAGVVRCGATHCTGDAAIGLFKREFGKDFLDLGVGRVLEFAP